MVMTPVVVSGQTITAMWDPSPASDQVTGYQVCVGTASLSCNIQLASVAATSYAIAPTGGVRTYVAVRAVNAAGAGSYSAEASFSIPGFPQPANQAGPVGVAIAPLSLSVSDPDGSALTFSHTGLPIGLSLNASTGQISGTPSVAGTYNVTVFVADKLATVSRSFVWTVTSGSTPDKSAPSLAIGSPTSGQTLNSTSVTISGTATDSGTGGSGITKVAVNGQAATGGTTSGNGTASWSRSLTLVSGANTITVEAYDGAGNVSMQQIALNVSFSTTSVPGVSLTASLPSPQNTGTAIKFMAAGSGGVAFEYLFRLRTVSGTQSWTSTVQNWSTSSTYTWTPSAAGSYVMIVFVRSAGSTSIQTSAEMAYVVNTPQTAFVSAVSVTPSSGSGAAQTFSLQYADSSGSANLATTWVWFNVTIGSTANSCLLYYDKRNAKLFLLNDTANGWIPGTLGTGTTLQNTQCRVALGSSSVSLSGTTLALTLAMTFTSTYTGTKNVYLYAANTAGSSSGWQDRGDWMVTSTSPTAASAPAPSAGVSAVSVTPGAGSGATQVFSLTYSDSLGAGDLNTEWAWFSPTLGPSAANSCLVYYSRPSNTLFLVDDSATVWLSAPLGSGTALQNSQCAIVASNSSVSVSGTTLTLNLAVMFKPAFSGTKNIYMFAASMAGVSSGWQDRGNWIVP